jgi:hypothetical protein
MAAFKAALPWHGNGRGRQACTRVGVVRRIGAQIYAP